MPMMVPENTPLTAGAPPTPTLRQRFFEELARRYPVPPEWAKGPIPDRRRRVTDMIFLILFVGCLMLMGMTTAWAFLKSTEGGFNRVRDSSGNVCGVGAAKAYPFLYMQTFSAPYRSVCVRKCPSFDYRKLNSSGFAAKNGSAKKTKTSALPMSFTEFSKKYAAKSHTYDEVLAEKEAFEYPKFWANERFSEAQWNAYLQSFSVECLPNQQFSDCKYSPNFTVYDSYAAQRKVCVPVSPKAAVLFIKVAARYRLGLVEDIRLLFPLLVRVAVFALLVSAALFGIVFGLPRSAVLVTAVLAVLSLLGVVGLIAQGLFGNGPLNNAFNPLRVKYLQFWIDHRFCMMFWAAAAVITAVFVVMQAVQNSRFLPVISHTVRVAGRQTLRSGLLLVVSAGIFVAELSVFFGGVITIAKLCATGKELLPADAPLTTYASPIHLKLMVALHVLGMCWTLAVLEGLRDFVIGAITVDSYFSAPIKPLHAFCHTLGHHVGSLAHFALLLPLRIVRRMMCGVCAVAALARGQKECWGASSSGYETFFGAVSRRFMTITYIGSVSFWRGARTSHALAEIFRGQVGPLIAVGELLGLCARVAATLLALLFGYWSYKGSMQLQQNVDNLWVLWLGAGCLGYFIGASLHSLFARTHDAVLGCYLVQLELNRQGYNFQAGPRELQDALAELNTLSRGGYRQMP